VGLVIASVAVVGCHRGYYRRQADAEADQLLRQKMCDPRWDSVDPSIAVDPASRMFDPFSADHPPLPPDDPAAHDLMHCVDDKPGYPHWHANGDTRFVESPEWRSYLPIGVDGYLVLDLPTAVDLSLRHSPDLQQQKETLYLSALDVSLERFGFDTQMFSAFNSFFGVEGRFRNADGSRTTLSTGTDGGGIELRKLGITGSTLVVGLTNSILWNFSGADTQTASTLINFTYIQPLLRDGGRDRIMESLTLAERGLLANVRQMERFRRGFYLSIATGRNPGAGPNLGGATLGLPSSASLSAGGYLGLLRAQQNIRIQQFNVQSLQDVLEQFRAFFAEDRIDLLQVRQAETSLYSAQQQLLNAQTDYEDALDRFKMTLGLPPDVPVMIRDPLLERFELISDELNTRQREYYELRTDLGAVLLRVDEVAVRDLLLIDAPDQPELVVRGLRWSDELGESLQAIIPIFDRLAPILRQVRDHDVPDIRTDFERLDAARPDRLAALARLRQQIAEAEVRYTIEPGILEEESIEETAELRAALDELLVRMDSLEASANEARRQLELLIAEGAQLTPAALFTRINEEVLRAIPDRLADLANAALELSLLQARARTDTVLLPDVNLHWHEALAIAREFRLDWMNARTALADSYRQIEFVADDLESQLDFVFEGDISNVGDNPFRLRYETGQLRGGFRFDAPITRLTERNQYRQTLIQYQQARRDYYQFEDEVSRNLRTTIRALDLSRIQFELSRRSVKVSVDQVELARLRLEEPPRITEGTRSGLGDTAANDLIDALNALQRTQIDFLNVYVDFEAQRQGLDFDLGTMQLTPDGHWIDPGVIDKTIAERAAVAMGLDPTCLPGLSNLLGWLASQPTPPPPSAIDPALLGPDGTLELPEVEEAVEEGEIPNEIPPAPQPNPPDNVPQDGG